MPREAPLKDAAQWLGGGGLMRVLSGAGAVAIVQHAGALLAESGKIQLMGDGRWISLLPIELVVGSKSGNV
jgi:hypothetical protein